VTPTFNILRDRKLALSAQACIDSRGVGTRSERPRAAVVSLGRGEERCGSSDRGLL